MVVLGDKGKKEGREQTESNGGKEMFWVWRIWSYGQSLQKWRKRGTSTSVSK